MADEGTAKPRVRSRRRLLLLGLVGLATVIAVTAAVSVALTLRNANERREADARDGVRWCHSRVLREATRAGKATESSEIRFPGEQFVVGENDADQRAIKVDGAVTIDGVESGYSCSLEYSDTGRMGWVRVRWADQQGPR